MTTADVRDMLDLPSDGQPRPVKKQKTVEKRPGKNNLLSHPFYVLIVARGYHTRVIRLTWRKSSTSCDHRTHQTQGEAKMAA